MNKFQHVAFTPRVLDAQKSAYGRTYAIEPDPGRDPLGPDEVAFIEARDSFYMATTSESGWPYVQHRGGPPGFLTALDEHTLAFADVRGNRQLVSIGNLATNDRVALILMDYPNRARLKLLAHAELLAADADLALRACRRIDRRSRRGANLADEGVGRGLLRVAIVRVGSRSAVRRTLLERSDVGRLRCVGPRGSPRVFHLRLERPARVA